MRAVAQGRSTWTGFNLLAFKIIFHCDFMVDYIHFQKFSVISMLYKAEYMVYFKICNNLNRLCGLI